MTHTTPFTPLVINAQDRCLSSHNYVYDAELTAIHGSFLDIANCGHFAPRWVGAFKKLGCGAKMQFFLQKLIFGEVCYGSW